MWLQYTVVRYYGIPWYTAAVYANLQVIARLKCPKPMYSLSDNKFTCYVHHHLHIRFWYLRCRGCPGLRGMQNLTLVLHEFLSNGLTQSRLHTVISLMTHADHVFLGLPRSLVPGSPNCVMELMHEVARCTCPYHLRRRVRSTFQNTTETVSAMHSSFNIAEMLQYLL